MEISPVWLWISGIFFALGIVSTLATIALIVVIMRFFKNVQPTISSVATKVEGVTASVESLTNKVESITGKVECIADTVRGIADSAKGVADSAKGTVQSVGGKAQGLMENLTNTAENTIKQTEGSKLLNAVMIGLQVFNAVQAIRAQTQSQVDKNGKAEGKMTEHRGVEQSGSSSGS